MSTHDGPVHPKDTLPPEEGVVHPLDEVEQLADDGPTEGADPIRDPEVEILDKRPTDGPM